MGDIHGRARIWSTDSWEPVTRWFAGHTETITGLAIGRHGRTLPTGSYDGTVRLWDIETEQAIGAPLPGLPKGPVWPLFTPDGTRLIRCLRNWRCIPLGHPARVAGPASLPRRRPASHARRMDGVLPQPRLQPSLLSPQSHRPARAKVGS